MEKNSRLLEEAKIIGSPGTKPTHCHKQSQMEKPHRGPTIQDGMMGYYIYY
jgi:hypothetical protein